MKLKIFSVLILLSVFGFGQFDDDLMDAFFDTLEQNDKFNGSVAINIKGETVYKRAIGFADFETKTKNNNETEFRIGSISKSFTATLTMIAVDEGKIKIDGTIEKYFPTVKNSDKITVDMLLKHRTGIFNITADSTYQNWKTQPKSEKEIIKIISGYDSNFEPGAYFEYSNSNYVLLSFLLEKLYKMSFLEILNQKIIQPLNLERTRFGGKINLNNNEAYSYQYTGDWLKSSEADLSILMGAGGIISTSGDITKFGEALFNGKLVSAESLELMKKTQDGYGYGMFLMPFYDKTGYGHTGGIDNFSSVWGYFPDGEVSFAITSNGADFNNNDIAIAILSVVYGRKLELPKFKQKEGEVIPGYTGIFSNGQLGMDIEITEKDGNYFAQATGQSAFPIEKKSDTEFRFDMAGIVIEFNPDLKSFTMKQGGGEFIFVKQ